MDPVFLILTKVWGSNLRLTLGKDPGHILNIKYSAGNRGWHDKGQGKKVKGERITDK